MSSSVNTRLPPLGVNSSLTADSRDPAADDVEHRREQEAEEGHADHAGEHRRAERLAHLRAGRTIPESFRHTT